jgi:hypothetical protein
MTEHARPENKSPADARELPSPEPTLALVLNRDLLFGSRIRSALAAIGMQGEFVNNGNQFSAALTSHPQDYAVAIVDMNGPVEWGTLGEFLGGADSPPTLAFGPHVDVEGRRAAKQAGVDRIVSNGQFASETISLIERYRRR